MPQSTVTVPWKEGLHLRAAARVVRSLQNFRSSVQIRHDGEVINARSVLGMLALCAAMGTFLQVETSGDDEREALAAVEQIFNEARPVAEVAEIRTRDTI